MGEYPFSLLVFKEFTYWYRHQCCCNRIKPDLEIQRRRRYHIVLFCFSGSYHRLPAELIRNFTLSLGLNKGCDYKTFNPQTFATLHPGVNAYLAVVEEVQIAGPSGRTALMLMKLPWVNKIIII